jgi:hypothetical protein
LPLGPRAVSAAPVAYGEQPVMSRKLDRLLLPTIANPFLK